jgi:hypothetical protein
MVLVAPLPICLDGMEENEKRKTQAANKGKMILSFIEIGLVKKCLFSGWVGRGQDKMKEMKIQVAVTRKKNVNA